MNRMIGESERTGIDGEYLYNWGDEEERVIEKKVGTTTTGGANYFRLSEEKNSATGDIQENGE